MGCCSYGRGIPPSTQVPEGKLRICAVGFRVSHHTGRAHEIIAHLARRFPDLYESWYYWTGMSEFTEYIVDKFKDVTFPDHLKGHGSSPAVWIEKTGKDGKPEFVEFIGGRSELVLWALDKHPGDPEIMKLKDAPPLIGSGTSCHAGCGCCAQTEPMWQSTADQGVYGPSTAAGCC